MIYGFIFQRLMLARTLDAATTSWLDVLETFDRQFARGGVKPRWREDELAKHLGQPVGCEELELASARGQASLMDENWDSSFEVILISKRTDSLCFKNLSSHIGYLVDIVR